MKLVVDKIAEEADITLQEIIDLFDLGISQPALCRRLKKLGYTYKKTLHPKAQKREDVVEERKQF